MINNRVIGHSYENKGIDYLKSLGFKILERNFRTRYGEIDIIASEKRFLVFIEIKFRSSNIFGLPQESVNSHKQYRIIKSALSYLKIKKILNANIRFDVLAIGPKSQDFELIRSAFDSPSQYMY